MERAGAGLADLVGELAPAGGSWSCAARATTAATGSWRRGCCASGVARSTCCCSATPRSCAATRGRTTSGCPGAPPEPFDGVARWTARPRSSTRSSAPASPASRASRRPARSRRSTSAGWRRRVRGRVRRPERRRRLDRRGRRARRCGRAPPPRSTPAKPGLWIAPGKAHAGEVARGRHRDPGRRPGEPQIGLISDRVSDGIPRRGRESTKFAAGSVLVCGGSIGLTGAPCHGLARRRCAPARAT